jgi:hypothetical protein
MVVLLRQHQKPEQQQDWPVLRFFPSWSLCRLAIMICLCTTTTTAAATTTYYDGAFIRKNRSSSSIRNSSSGRSFIIPSFATQLKRNGDDSITTRFPQCRGATASGSSLIQGLCSRQAAAAAAATAAGTRLLSIRGGGGGIIVSAARAMLDSISASKTKCWILLIVCILAETWATSLSKTARDEQSPSIFAASLLLYSAWYVSFPFLLARTCLIQIGSAC